MTKTEAKIEDVKDLIVRCLHLPDVRPSSIVDDAPLFVEGLGLDSVDALELVVGVEKEYELQIEDEAIGKEAFASAAALTAFINDRLKNDRLKNASRDHVHDQ